MVQKTIAHIETREGSPFAVAIEVSGHTLIGDEPTGSGGAGLGPSPFDLLTAALGECTAMTIRWYAAKHDWPLEQTRVEVQHGKKIRAGSGEVVDEFRIAMEVIGAQLSDEQRSKLYEIATECPVHQALTGTIAITMSPQDTKPAV
jgi:putative redox protein